MTDSPLLDALEHAEATGDGSPYTLRITMTSGLVLEGISASIDRDEWNNIAGVRLIGHGDEADVFVNQRNIETVTVQW